MHLVFLKVAQQVIDLLGLWHKIGRTNQTLPSERGGLANMRQQVLDIKHTTDIVSVALVDGYAAVVVFKNALKHLVEIGLHAQVDNILTRGHDFLGCLVAKTNDALQHALLLLDFLLVGEFKGLLQVVDTQDMALLLEHLTCQGATADEDGLNGPEQSSAYHQSTHRKPAILQRILAGIDLGHDLSKQKQEEGEDDGDTQKL